MHVFREEVSSGVGNKQIVNITCGIRAWVSNVGILVNSVRRLVTITKDWLPISKADISVPLSCLTQGVLLKQTSSVQATAGLVAGTLPPSPSLRRCSSAR